MLENKENKLKSILKNYKSAAIAFSGGTDSTLLLYELSQLNIDITAFTYHSCAYPEKELELAKKTAEKFNVKHIIINLDPFKEIENIENNPTDRCYICKKYLYKKIKEYADKEKIEVVIDGSNYDDLSDYRPGRKAVKELGIISPLEMAEITKKDVRELLKKANLEQAEKKSFACYFSRFPFNNKITYDDMKRVSICEEYIHNLGLNSARLRIHNDIARIETNENEMIQCITNMELKNKIISFLKENGFKFVTIDLEGYRTGSMNKTASK